nr:TonB-dependent receptor [Bacteroides intestinalis]
MFGYLSGYNFNKGGAVLDGKYVIGVQPGGMPVTDLSWEKNTTYDVGVDMKFLDNRLSLSFDLFKKVISGRPAARYDILLPSEVGYSLPNENLNKDEYRGMEGMISYADNVGELEYNVSANFTYSRFRNVETYKPRFGNSWNEYRNSIEDRWGGVWWGYQVIGQFQSEEEIRNYPINNDGENNRTQLPGDLIYKDVNGDGIINSMDERPIGYPTGWSPMLSFGGNIGLRWKGIDLNMDFAGGGMQSWCQDYELRNPFHAGGNSPAFILEDRWHRADPYNPDSEWISGKYPAIRKGTSVNNGKNSDFWLHDVRFLRLKNVELGYSLPKELISKINVQRLRLYVSASNLFSIDNVGEYEIDPEIEARAAVVYPQQRTIMVGFNVTF